MKASFESSPKLVEILHSSAVHLTRPSSRVIFSCSVPVAGPHASGANADSPSLFEAGVDIQQCGGQPALPLIRVPPPIHLGTPLFHQGIDRLQTVGRFEGGPQEGKYA